MARERDVQDDRFFESLFYGTPTYNLSRTPDGRIVSELSRGRKEEARRHADAMTVQRELVDALSRVHGGTTVVSREAFNGRLPEIQGLLVNAAGQLGALNRTGEGLLAETRLLNRITGEGFSDMARETRGLSRVTAAGFDDLGQRVDGTTRAVRGVWGEVSAGRSDAYLHARESQGPRPPKETVVEVVHTQRRLLQMIAAHQNGLLTDAAKREVERILDSRLSSIAAQSHVERLIGVNIRDNALKLRAQELTSIIQKPSRLIVPEGKDNAIQDLRRLETVVKAYPNEELRAFIGDAYALLSMSEQARNIPLDEELLIDLTNSGLVIDAIRYEVKKRSREARMDGSAVDRNFNLIELLQQGDRAAEQRQAMLWGQAHLVKQGAEAAGQRERVLQELGAQTQIGLRTNEHLTDIIGSIVGIKDQIVHLDQIAGEFVDAVDFGFSQVTETLSAGFAMEHRALNSIAIEIAISRAATLSLLKRIDSTIEKVGANIQRDIQFGNAQLERIVALTEDSLGNNARQRFRQGMAFLKEAETPDDFREALKLFMRGIDDDPTTMGNQYGVAVSAEALGDQEEAITRYRNLGKMAHQAEIASIGWMKHGELKAKSGELPVALVSLRKALEKNPHNDNARYLLARSLALSGLVKEAEEILLELIGKDKSYIKKLVLDSSFNEKFLVRIYKIIWEQRNNLKISRGLMMYLLVQLNRFGEVETTEQILDYTLRYSPEFLLDEALIDKLSQNLKEKISRYVEELATKTPQVYTAEIWYAYAFIALVLKLSSRYIAILLKQGFEQDFDHHKGNLAAVKQKLEKIGGTQVSDLLKKVGVTNLS